MAIAVPDNVISHWSKLIENFQVSPMAFYASVEAAIQKRQVPQTATDRIEYRQGVTSAHRIYLRIQRGRDVFDVCAAPFGTGFFFSSWFAQVPLLSTLQRLGIMGGLLFVLAILTGRSLISGPIQFLGLLLLTLFFFAMNQSGADECIFELPLVGRIYSRLFKPSTYYRYDTAAMFQQAVHNAVLEVIDEITTTNGIRSLSELERKPILKSFAHSA